MHTRFRASYRGRVDFFVFVCLCKSKQASCCAKSNAEMVLGPFVCLLVCFISSSVRLLDIEYSSQRRLLLCLAPRRVHFARPSTQASKPALTDCSLAPKRRAEAFHWYFFNQAFHATTMTCTGAAV